MKRDAQSLSENDTPEFVSIGQLPPDVQVQTFVDNTHALYRTNTDGLNAQH